jgi:hypothetical protein
MSKIFAIILSFFMSTTVLAGTKITVLQGESPGSIAHEFINTVVTELKTKYNTVDVITAGNCTKAVEIYNKFDGKNLLFVFYADHWLSNEMGKHNCGVPVTQTNLVFLTSQAQVICTRGNVNADFNNFKNGKTFGFPFPHDFWTEVVKDINKNIETIEDINKSMSDNIKNINTLIDSKIKEDKNAASKQTDKSKRN